MPVNVRNVRDQMERLDKLMGMRRIENVRRVDIIRVTGIKGAGTEDDPVRHCWQYWDLDGDLLATVDSRDLAGTVQPPPEDQESEHERATESET